MSGKDKVPSIAETRADLLRLFAACEEPACKHGAHDAVRIMDAVRPLLEELRIYRCREGEREQSQPYDTADIDRLLAPEPAK